MKRLAVILGMVVALVGFMTVGAQAIPSPSISGGISFGALNLTFDNNDLSVATEILNFNTPFVTNGVGDYGSITGLTPVTFAEPLVFKPATLPINPLWTFSFGGKTYSFEATSLVITKSDPDDLTIEGNGIASITGFADTSGFWVITATSSTEGSFSFASSAGTPVPEPATLLLLGSGLAGLGLYRRKKA